MKTIILAAILQVLALDCFAASTVTDSQGRRIQFGEWSVPKNISIPASGTAHTVLLRSSEAQIVSEPGNTQIIDFIANPKTGHYWIGRRFPSYAFFADRIIGIEMSGVLNLKEGFSSAQAIPDESVELAKGLQSFVERPFSSHAGKTIQLADIFGRDALVGLASEGIPVGAVTEVSVGEKSIAISLTSASGNALKVSLDSNLIPFAAEANGRPVLLLSDGVERLPLDPSSPKPAEVTSENGSVASLQMSLDHPYTDVNGKRRVYLSKAVILPSSGLVWFGPYRCQMFLWGSKLVGIEENAMKLNLYVSDRRIPTSVESKAAFRAALDEFARAVSSGAFKPTSQVDMQALFDSDLRDQTEIVVEDLRQSGNDLEIKVRRTDASDTRFKVSVTNGLQIGKKEKVSVRRVRPSQ